MPEIGSKTLQNTNDSTIRLRRVRIPPSALNEQESAAVVRLAERLDNELSAILTRLGATARSPRALSRLIEADFKLCQRTLKGLKDGHGQPAMMLLNLPGPGGLRDVVDRMVRLLGGQQANLPVQQAVDQYEKLCFQLGGSHAGLRRRLSLPGTLGASTIMANQEQSIAARRGIQRHAAELLGSQTDMLVALVIIRPTPTDPTRTELITVTALVGFTSSVQGVPLISHQSLSKSTMEQVAEQARITPLGEAFGAPSGLIREFSSSNIPISSFEGTDGQCRHVVDLPPGRSMDFVLASHSGPDVNQKLARSYWTQTIGVRRPSKRLVLDVYVHEQLQSATLPIVASVLWHPGLSNDPRRFSTEKLPTFPRLEVLGHAPGTGVAAPWPRLPALTAHVFSLAHWPMHEFVGYRCDEPAPIWGSMYMMSFDYRENSVRENSVRENSVRENDGRELDGRTTDPAM